MRTRSILLGLAAALAVVSVGVGPLVGSATAAAGDRDDDGLGDEQEAFWGSDPDNPDSDGDGLTDGEEIRGLLLRGVGDPINPDLDGDGVPDGLEDLDGDGLVNVDEKARATNMLWPDTDLDGLSDGQEVAWGSDPLRWDSDADGARDGDTDADGDGLGIAHELALGTDPYRADTDGDGISDADEVTLCTDPTRRDSDRDGVGDDADDAFCLTRAAGGLADWKLFQRTPDGTARVPVAFRYRLAIPARLEVAVVETATGLALAGHDFGDHAIVLAAAGGPRGSAGELALTLVTGGNYDVRVRVVDADGSHVLFAQTVESIAVGDVFLAAGQSNMSGPGLYVPPDPADAPDPRVHLFGNDDRWKQGREPMDDATDAVAVVSNGNDLQARVSPMLRFAKEVAVAAGVPVGIVPGPASGTSLLPEPLDPYATSWSRRAEQPDDRHTLYGSAIARVRLQGYDSPIRGVIWYQGEADAHRIQTSVHPYLEALGALVANLRADLAAPALFFASCQLSTSLFDNEEMESWMIVREAQRQYAVEDPASALVSLLDLPHGNIHLDPPGYREAGRRLALAVLQGVYGMPLSLGPRLRGIHRSGDGRRVWVVFDRRIYAANVNRFRVRSGDVVFIPTALRLSSRRVRFFFGAPVPPEATISYGYGTLNDTLWIKAVDGSGAALAFKDLPLMFPAYARPVPSVRRR